MCTHSSYYPEPYSVNLAPALCRLCGEEPALLCSPHPGLGWECLGRVAREEAAAWAERDAAEGSAA